MCEGMFTLSWAEPDLSRALRSGSAQLVHPRATRKILADVTRYDDGHAYWWANCSGCTDVIKNLKLISRDSQFFWTILVTQTTQI